MKTSQLTSSDYNPYYKAYIEALGEVDLMKTLKKQVENYPQFLGSIPEDKLNYSYAEGKWTVAEVLVHVLDSERVFQYRALRFARKDETPLPGFDQDLYVPASGANHRSIESIIEEYKAIRRSTIALYESFEEGVLKRRGVASNSTMSVGALGFIICGHQKHHRNIIRERYL
ncbi:DinB family protein [Muriicola marianensis]|uniref:DNA damage-inducible protein DinB n=1 Tax=Muriicola marianensis TaxID=1324801 RepID=A0ABQ1QR23_9FLAO|nr:DinB family protein [Muriicola marianensis]GGD38361.1 DNA damage-inducible protein DinB [Muriicola marianensis]